MTEEIRHHSQDLAVALNYDGQNTPRITAKGQNEIARQILEKAEEAEIPLRYDPELAAILSQIPLGEEIPESLYRAVAEVIAFAYFIAGKTPEGWLNPSDNEGETD
jgi:flagellar biosynthesis protein